MDPALTCVPKPFYCAAPRPARPLTQQTSHFHESQPTLFVVLLPFRLEATRMSSNQSSNQSFCGNGRGFFDQDIEPGGEYDWHSLFDFSTCFEESIVTSVPAMFIAVAGMWRLLVLCKLQKWTRIRSSRLYVIKQVRRSAQRYFHFLAAVFFHRKKKNHVVFCTPPTPLSHRSCAIGQDRG